MLTRTTVTRPLLYTDRHGRAGPVRIWTRLNDARVRSLAIQERVDEARAQATARHGLRLRP